MMAVDVVSREAVRDFCVYGENLFMQWDGSPIGLKEKDMTYKELKSIQLYGQEEARHDENYSRNIIENAYENEIKAFVASITEGKKPVYGYEDDGRILAWIDRIEAGMKS